MAGFDYTISFYTLLHQLLIVLPSQQLTKNKEPKYWCCN